VTCRECKTTEVPDGQGTVCSGCRPAVRARRIPPEEMLRRIDEVLRG
jgi:hypothetical protein